MKTVVILETVSLPNMPGYRKGEECRMKDEIAELLVERGHAKYHTGKSREVMDKQRAKVKKADVVVSKTDKKGDTKEISSK
ncbi:MAG: hypothetical protein V3T43_06155 [Nitrosomonadaceae bacterium]